MATWLVTGAAGFIGSHVCERLLTQGERVIGVDSLDGGGAAALTRARVDRLAGHRGFELVVGDVAAPGAAEDVVATYRPRTVVHLAARTGVRGSAEAPIAYTDCNVTGTVALLEACRRRAVAHVVYASSSSVYGDGVTLPAGEHEPAVRPLSLYAATKRAGELAAHSYAQVHGLPTTGVRLFTVYGPWGRPDMAYYRFAEAIASGGVVEIYGDGSARRDFTFVDDVVEGVLAVAARPPQGRPGEGVPWAVYNLGRGRSESVGRLVGLLEELLERPARRRYVAAAPGDAAATQADPSQLADATGFAPRICLDEGLERFVNWFLAYRQATARPPAAPARRAAAARAPAPVPALGA